MTPAEKFARYLDDEGETVHAEIVRRLAAALDTADKAMEKLSDGSTISEFRKVYADALRDVKEQA